MPKGSISRWAGKIDQIEASTGGPNVKTTSQRFKERRIENVIDSVDGEVALGSEQAILDEHDEIVSQLMMKLDKIIKASSPMSMHTTRDLQSTKLVHLRQDVGSPTSYTLV